MTRKVVRCCLCVVMLGAILSTSGCQQLGEVAGDALVVGAVVGLDLLASGACDDNQLNFFPLDHGHDHDHDGDHDQDGHRH